MSSAQPGSRSPISLLSIAMPVYNEEAAIEQVIRDHVAVLGRLGDVVPRWEIVCVDDGSKDTTPAILKRLQGEFPQLRVVRQENQGIYAAVTKAYQTTRGSHIFNTGSDGQWPAENLEIMLPKLLDGADLVMGVRTNRREVYTISRRFVSRCFNLLPRILFGVAIEDAGSIKIGVRKVFEFPLKSRSVFFEAERIIVASRAGCRVDFVPIRFLTRSGGKATGASWKNIYRSVRDLFLCLRVYGFR